MPTRQIIAATAVATALLAGAATAVAPAAFAATTTASQAAGRSVATGPPPGARQFGRIYCSYGALCTFHDGDYVSYEKCQRIYLTDWTGEGSFMNNQTTGTVTTWYGKNGLRLGKTSTAFDQNGIDWGPIYSFRVC